MPAVTYEDNTRVQRSLFSQQNNPRKIESSDKITSNMYSAKMRPKSQSRFALKDMNPRNPIFEGERQAKPHIRPVNNIWVVNTAQNKDSTILTTAGTLKKSFYSIGQKKLIVHKAKKDSGAIGQGSAAPGSNPYVDSVSGCLPSAKK